MTSEEASNLLNEPVREICFELSQGSAELSCEVEGFEGSNSALEVLRMERGGGLRSQRRSSSLRHATRSRAVVGWASSG
eukprot:1185172-Pyramimonas_sp.AAC.1